MVVGAAMNIGSKINDAYTFINAGLPHQVYEAVGAGVFFVAVAMLLFRWDKERHALPTTVPSKGRTYTPAELSEIAKRKPVTGLDVVQRLEKLEEERSAGSTLKVTGTVIPAAKYSKAQINKIVGAIDALYPPLIEIEQALISATWTTGSLEAIIRDQTSDGLLKQLDQIRLKLIPPTDSLEREMQNFSLYTEVCRILEDKNNLHDAFFLSFNELVSVVRQIPANMPAQAIAIFVEGKKATFIEKTNAYLAWVRNKKKSLSENREWYLRRPTTD